MTFGDDTFVAAGDRGIILTSSSGSNWKKRISATTNNLGGVTFGDHTFVAAGMWDSILQSYSDSVSVADLTGQWTSVNETCNDSKKGIKCSIEGKFIIQNIGEGDAESAVVKYYLSDDDIFDDGDTFLKSVSEGKIIAGTVLPKTFKKHFAAGVSLSGKYIIAVVDADNTIVESDENNNYIAYGPLQ